MVHTLTTEQLHKLSVALGDGSKWPKYTDDPQVNYAVDCVVQFQIEEGEGPPASYNEIGHLYIDEINALKESGLDPVG